ncbi:MAG: tetratricopeptide repeat protein, partial [Myxococcota bacterium]
AVAWTRSAPRLDPYPAYWVPENTPACAATHVRLEQSERTLDLRMACLATAKRDLAAAVEVLADADDDVAAHADRIVDGLPAIDACRSVPPPGRSGASRAQSGAESDAASSPELDGALARSAALRRAGRYDAAWDAVTQAEALLRDVDAPRRAAAARLERGIIQSERGKYPGARDDLTAAMRAAIELDDPRMAGRAGHWLVHTVGLLQDEPEAAALTGQLALGFAARSGDRQLEAQVRVVNANLAAKARRFDEAEAGLRAVIAMHEAEPGQPVAARAAAFQGLGNVLLTVHEPAAAEAAFRSAIELGTELGADHPSVLVGRLGLASAVKAAGDAAAAEVILREVAALQIAALGEYHPDVALTYHNLGNALLDGAKLRDAEAAYRSALAIRVATIGPEANETSSTRTSLGNVLRAQNKLEEAAAVLRETIAILHETRGPASLEVAYAQGNLASVLRMAGDTPGAETTIRAALSTMRTKLGDDHPHVATARNNLGNLLTASGRPKLAEAEHRRALEIRVGRLGGDHPMVAFSHHNLGEALAAQGRTAEARASLEQALALRERTIGAEHPETDRSRTALEELGNGKLRGGDEGVDLGEP